MAIMVIHFRLKILYIMNEKKIMKIKFQNQTLREKK